MTPTCFLSFDVEDWFQVENLRHLYPPESWNDCRRRIDTSTRVILELLAEFNISTTFFILGWVAERETQLVQDIASAGHEIACHGYSHILPLTRSVDHFRTDVSHAQSILQEITGHAVAGYRAPSFNLDDARLEVLDDLGFRYDSSYNPVSWHDRYAPPPPHDRG